MRIWSYGIFSTVNEAIKQSKALRKKYRGGRYAIVQRSINKFEIMDFRGLYSKDISKVVILVPNTETSNYFLRHLDEIPKGILII